MSKGATELPFIVTETASPDMLDRLPLAKSPIAPLAPRVIVVPTPLSVRSETEPPADAGDSDGRGARDAAGGEIDMAGIVGDEPLAARDDREQRGGDDGAGAARQSPVVLDVAVPPLFSAMELPEAASAPRFRSRRRR